MAARTGSVGRLRQRLSAWLMARGSAAHAKYVEAERRALVGALEGTVLEIGPGAGTNLAYLDPSVRWVGAEPNPFMLGYLAPLAGRRWMVGARAEGLPLADASVDAVLSTLVLCSVGDLPGALAEVRRVLKPGGVFAFLEHCAAPAGTSTRWVQRLVGPAWCLVSDGCRPDREIPAAIEAAGFAAVEARRFGLPLPVIGPHVIGTARR